MSIDKLEKQRAELEESLDREIALAYRHAYERAHDLLWSVISDMREEAHLAQERLIQEDHQREHQHGGTRGQAPEAGRGDSHEQGGEVQIKAWEGVKEEAREVDNHPDAVYADKWEKHVREVDKYKCGSCGRLSCGCAHY